MAKRGKRADPYTEALRALDQAAAKAGAAEQSAREDKLSVAAKKAVEAISCLGTLPTPSGDGATGSLFQQYVSLLSDALRVLHHRVRFAQDDLSVAEIVRIIDVLGNQLSSFAKLAASGGAPSLDIPTTELELDQKIAEYEAKIESLKAPAIGPD